MCVVGSGSHWVLEEEGFRAQMHEPRVHTVGNLSLTCYGLGYGWSCLKASRPFFHSTNPWQMQDLDVPLPSLQTVPTSCLQLPLPRRDWGCLLPTTPSLSPPPFKMFHWHPAPVWEFWLDSYENHLPIIKASLPLSSFYTLLFFPLCFHQSPPPPECICEPPWPELLFLNSPSFEAGPPVAPG